MGRKLVEDLASLRFITENRPILFLGQPGCGKTHLAVVLATRAVEAGYRGYFATADDMTRTLVQAQVEGTFPAKLKTFTAPTVLVIDDVGLLLMPEPRAASVLYHVVNHRYQALPPTTNRFLPDFTTPSTTSAEPSPTRPSAATDETGISQRQLERLHHQTPFRIRRRRLVALTEAACRHAGITQPDGTLPGDWPEALAQYTSDAGAGLCRGRGNRLERRGQRWCSEKCRSKSRRRAARQ